MPVAGKWRYWCGPQRRIQPMQREAVYEAWVPEKSAWSLWARPVLFGHMSRTSGTDSVDPTPIRWAWALFGSAADTPAAEPEQPWRNIPVDWAPPPSDNAVLIVDLPGEEGVHV